ncbi:hypothetical protein [Microbacterium karelineae]|uniref:hypothetical protein n=1 Tax=Microbacterium karelineae TaxID=2654283 RepID=UPI0012EA4B10|nr:hypothetical protein [Microbacterium karelineae]
MTPEEQLKFIEGVSSVCDILDSFKNGLEERGWQPTLAAQAAIQVGGPVILAGQAQNGRR